MNDQYSTNLRSILTETLDRILSESLDSKKSFKNEINAVLMMLIFLDPADRHAVGEKLNQVKLLLEISNNI